MLLGCFLVPPAILAGELGSNSEPVLTLEEAGSLHSFFAQFGKDYVPPISAVSLLDAAESDLMIVDREIRGTHIMVQWDSQNGMIDVWKNGVWIDDLDVSFDDRIVFSGAYLPRRQAETGQTILVARVTGSIVAGPEGMLIVAMGNFRGIVHLGQGGIASHGPQPIDVDTSSCRCLWAGHRRELLGREL